MASTTPCMARMRFAAIRSSMSAGSAGPADAGRCCASAGTETSAAAARQMLKQMDAHVFIGAPRVNSASAEIRFALFAEGQRPLLRVFALPHALDLALGEIHLLHG